MVNPASTWEIEEAIRALTDADNGRLKRFTTQRLMAIGRAAAGNDWTDLLQEAITRTLDGTRKWNKNEVPFVGHLMGVVKSLCSGLAEKMGTQKHEEPMLESELAGVPDDPAMNPYQLAVSQKPDPERILEAREVVAATKDYFRDDSLVLDLISCLEEGLSGLEIKELLGISQKDLNTVMRRLQRSKPKVLP
jgi:hypothetical protein